MLSRRAMLLVSFMTAVAMYSGLYAIAPKVFLLRANSTVNALPQRMHVELLDSVTQERFAPPPDDAVTMSSRPAIVEFPFRGRLGRTTMLALRANRPDYDSDHSQSYERKSESVHCILLGAQRLN